MQLCALCGGAASSKMHIVGILSTTLLWCISPGVVATTFSLVNRCTNQNKLLISDLKILEIYLGAVHKLCRLKGGGGSKIANFT